jgi:hypothetical protein
VVAGASPLNALETERFATPEPASVVVVFDP